MSRLGVRLISSYIPVLYVYVIGVLYLFSPVLQAQEPHQTRVLDEAGQRNAEKAYINTLRTACRQGEIGTAVDIIDDLFEIEVSPLRVYGVIRSMSSRMDVTQFSRDLEKSMANTAATNNLIMILAYSMRDSVGFERIQSAIQENRWWDGDILQRIGREAISREDWPTARWSFVSMDETGHLTEHAEILSLARVFYHTREPDRTLMMLDRLGDMSHLPRIYGDQARILRARIHFHGTASINRSLSLTRFNPTEPGKGRRPISFPPCTHWWHSMIQRHVVDSFPPREEHLIWWKPTKPLRFHLCWKRSRKIPRERQCFRP